MGMPGLSFQRKQFVSRLNRVYRRSELYKLRRWLKGKSVHWLLYLALSGLALAIGLGVHYYQYCHLYAVRVDGEEVGLVRSPEEMEHFVKDLTEKCGSYYQMDLFPEQEITLTREYRPGEMDDIREARETLRQRLGFLTDAVMVIVDGIPVAPVATEKGVEQLVEQLCLSFVNESNCVELLDVQVLEEVAGEKCAVSPEQVYSPGEIASLLMGQKKERELLIASRGTALSRSGRHKGEKSIPTVHVRSVEKVTTEERIPFTTKYKASGKMYRGESRVVTPGKKGLKKVTYRITRENGAEQSRTVVSSNVIKKPKSRVVERGTMNRFAWPVACGGRITQRFSAWHRGVDIAAPLNSSVLAAESGVVIESTRGGSQGNYIIIDHGSYYTLYLHNNRNLVSAGQRVSRGQTIASLGSSGRSSGPHLHFEIRRKISSSWGGWYNHPAINPLQFF